jgi:hypothetical protein
MRMLAIALLLSLPLAAFSASAAPKIATFTSEENAHIRCPYDVIVWLNPRTKLWYTNKSRHYANDRFGAFVCKQEAMDAGMKKGKD